MAKADSIVAALDKMAVTRYETEAQCKDAAKLIVAARAKHAALLTERDALKAAVGVADELAAYCKGYFGQPGSIPQGEPTTGWTLLAAYRAARKVQP